jgi:hypothetical protein
MKRTRSVIPQTVETQDKNPDFRLITLYFNCDLVHQSNDDTEGVSDSSRLGFTTYIDANDKSCTIIDTVHQIIEKINREFDINPVYKPQRVNVIGNSNPLELDIYIDREILTTLLFENDRTLVVRVDLIPPPRIHFTKKNDLTIFLETHDLDC